MAAILDFQLEQFLQWSTSHLDTSSINAYGPYKCMGKQIWPCRKRVKCQHRTIILVILVDILSPIICAKIRAQDLFGYGEEYFKGFNHIWASQPFWSMDHAHFSNLPFSCSKEAPHEIWAKLAQRLQRRSFENINIFTIHMYGAHTNAYRSKLDLAVKRSTANVRPSF